jgi:ferritin-like metal-binding protein YciE
VAQVLQQTLDEEKQTNEQLTNLAENMTNVQAASVEAVGGGNK